MANNAQEGARICFVHVCTVGRCVVNARNIRPKRNRGITLGGAHPRGATTRIKGLVYVYLWQVVAVEG